ncbi:MAG TPA: aquaporin [Nitrospiraceae bacterium]|nr:aquaporin [Nitrospiraceae bacterium]
MRAPSDIVRAHWPEYLMEAAGLGFFMISAAVVTSLVEYPHSPLYPLLPDPAVRRVLIGIAMGLTAMGIMYSPWGKRSGAHLNPAVTVTFFRLGKIEGFDALCYVLAQFVGGLIGLLAAGMAIGMAIEHPAVNYVVTVPGFGGTGMAFIAEACISFGLMLVVLIVSNRTKLNAWTGVFAGVLVATYIAVEAPLSGMSMNPARSFASALPAHLWTDFWVYLTAPLLGMLLAAECYVRLPGARRVLCAKLHHHNNARCIFRCNFMP